MLGRGPVAPTLLDYYLSEADRRWLPPRKSEREREKRKEKAQKSSPATCARRNELNTEQLLVQLSNKASIPSLNAEREIRSKKREMKIESTSTPY